jgi:hypothetical protein
MSRNISTHTLCYLMLIHDHGFHAGEWPFADPENTTAIACVHVLEGHPILVVTHDDDDGSWQVLCGAQHESSEAKVVCLGCMVKREPGLAALADLPLGGYAERGDLKSAWLKYRHT